MKDEQMPPLPTIVHGRVIDGIAALTVYEHVHHLYAYARAYAAQQVAKEREACAALCETLFDTGDDSCDEAEKCAAAIRARGAA